MDDHENMPQEPVNDTTPEPESEPSIMPPIPDQKPENDAPREPDVSRLLQDIDNITGQIQIRSKFFGQGMTLRGSRLRVFTEALKCRTQELEEYVAPKDLAEYVVIRFVDGADAEGPIEGTDYVKAAREQIKRDHGTKVALNELVTIACKMYLREELGDEDDEEPTDDIKEDDTPEGEKMSEAPKKQRKKNYTPEELEDMPESQLNKVFGDTVMRKQMIQMMTAAGMSESKANEVWPGLIKTMMDQRGGGSNTDLDLNEMLRFKMKLESLKMMGLGGSDTKKDDTLLQLALSQNNKPKEDSTSKFEQILANNNNQFMQVVNDLKGEMKATQERHERQLERQGLEEKMKEMMEGHTKERDDIITRLEKERNDMVARFEAIVLQQQKTIDGLQDNKTSQDQEKIRQLEAEKEERRHQERIAQEERMHQNQMTTINTVLESMKNDKEEQRKYYEQTHNALMERLDAQAKSLAADRPDPNDPYGIKMFQQRAEALINDAKTFDNSMEAIRTRFGLKEEGAVSALEERKSELADRVITTLSNLGGQAIQAYTGQAIQPMTPPGAPAMPAPPGYQQAPPGAPQQPAAAPQPGAAPGGEPVYTHSGINPHDGTLYIHPKDAAEFVNIVQNNDAELMSHIHRLPDSNQGAHYLLPADQVGRFNKANDAEGQKRAGTGPQPAAAPQPAAPAPGAKPKAVPKPVMEAARKKSALTPDSPYEVDMSAPTAASSARPLVSAKDGEGK